MYFDHTHPTTSSRRSIQPFGRPKKIAKTLATSSKIDPSQGLVPDFRSRPVEIRRKTTRLRNEIEISLRPIRFNDIQHTYVNICNNSPSISVLHSRAGQYFSGVPIAGARRENKERAFLKTPFFIHFCSGRTG